MTAKRHSPNNGTSDLEETTILEFPLKRIKELQSFSIALENPLLEEQCKDDAIFSLTLQLAIDEYGISQTDIAGLLRTQKSTVGRWKSAASAPITYSRPAILSVINTLLKRTIEEKLSNIKNSRPKQ